MTYISDGVDLPHGSLYQDGKTAADRHKWIESEKHGHDVGDRAIREWFRIYWVRHCRIRRIEHAIGNRCWLEFQDSPSQILLQLLEENDLLFDLILDRVADGWENLDVIFWALDWNLPMDRVHLILCELNINSARLEPRFQ